ncbi:hypothetical protein N7533_009667 [Penicillium manginii]|jgi:hypothetical protein|uniref:uncharacterized protein n=1 Tax=Penicillium manginii TaxID=203109 RepID=UPI002547C5F3|nr:uncharacterized protein N7533_009667 [Penicillium manginii]KAJ5744797.1 hypothetical protein N7533_009667 [Penicillium manginii]
MLETFAQFKGIPGCPNAGQLADLIEGPLPTQDPIPEIHHQPTQVVAKSHEAHWVLQSLLEDIIIFERDDVDGAVAAE